MLGRWGLTAGSTCMGHSVELAIAATDRHTQMRGSLGLVDVPEYTAQSESRQAAVQQQHGVMHDGGSYTVYGGSILYNVALP